MPIDVPVTRKEIADRIRTDVQSLLPQSNPFLPESWIDSLISAVAGRDFDIYKFLELSVNVLFPDTAVGEFIDRWGNLKSVNRKAATPSDGFITTIGTLGTIIPSGSVLTSQAGINYETQADATISPIVLDVVSLTRSGSIVTVTTTDDHHYYTGLSQTISEADDDDYNVTALVKSIISKTIFTYEITGTPPTPDPSATIKTTATLASSEVKSQTFGADTNAVVNTKLTFSIFIIGASANSYVQSGGLKGGTDDESDADYLKRVLDAYQNPISNFNESDIIRQARTVDGVTRVTVWPITPGVGDTTIYFVRDNDGTGTDIIPTPDEVDDVADAILKIAPPNMDRGADLIIAAPTPNVIDFSFATIEPSSSTMEEAIRTNLQLFFTESVEIGYNIAEDAYRSAIQQTVDPQNGNPLLVFDLTSPSGDIGIDMDEVGILGTVSF